MPKRVNPPKFRRPTGEQVLRHRLSLDMTQARYGRMVGVAHYQNVSRWETDPKRPMPGDKWRLARLLGKEILRRRRLRERLRAAKTVGS